MQVREEHAMGHEYACAPLSDGLGLETQTA